MSDRFATLFPVEKQEQIKKLGNFISFRIKKKCEHETFKTRQISKKNIEKSSSWSMEVQKLFIVKGKMRMRHEKT